jgi:hypothetical protein
MHQRDNANRMPLGVAVGSMGGSGNIGDSRDSSGSDDIADFAVRGSEFYLKLLQHH